MPRRYAYATTDVFTDRPYGGNPLAVVLDAAGLSTAEMQAIAAEFAYSETTFVLPSADTAHTARVRIFTPRTEMPFAGHPNVGTAFVLARVIAARGETLPAQFLFEEGAGLVPVRLLRDGPAVVGAELTAPEALTLGPPIEIAPVAACLGLTPEDIRVDAHPPQVASVGFPFLVVELTSRAALRQASPDLAAYARLLPRDGADAIYAYTHDVDRNEAETALQARMFAPLDGILEDPATGSATAAAVAFIARIRGLDSLTLKIGQGVDMGRPSLLIARVAPGPTTHVGGQCVPMMEGMLTV